MQLDQKLKELDMLRDEMVLVIRKAFTFSEGDIPRSFVLGKHNDKGFGLVLKMNSPKYPYILVYPDVVTRRLRVTFRFPWHPEEEVFYIDCVVDLQTAERELRQLILGYLSTFATGGEIDW